VNVDVSPALVPALMPLLARLRQLLDLDAVPTAIDAHLTQGGLGALVERHPGLRLPGAMNGFDLALRVLLRGHASRVVHALGTPIDGGVAALSLLAPDAPSVAAAGEARLVALGVPRRRAESVVAVARAIADGVLRLEPGSGPVARRTRIGPRRAGTRRDAAAARAARSGDRARGGDGPGGARAAATAVLRRRRVPRVRFLRRRLGHVRRRRADHTGRAQS